MGEIRIVGPGKTRGYPSGKTHGYPYPVCKFHNHIGSDLKPSIFMVYKVLECLFLLDMFLVNVLRNRILIQI